MKDWMSSENINGPCITGYITDFISFIQQTFCVTSIRVS